MATVIVTISTKEQEFPAGTIGGNYAYDLIQGGTALQHVESSQLSVSFSSVTPGDYSARAQRLDSSGTPIGSFITSAFVVPEPTTLVSVPETITVTLI